MGFKNASAAGDYMWHGWEKGGGEGGGDINRDAYMRQPRPISIQGLNYVIMRYMSPDMQDSSWRMWPIRGWGGGGGWHWGEAPPQRNM